MLLPEPGLSQCKTIQGRTGDGIILVGAKGAENSGRELYFRAFYKETWGRGGRIKRAEKREGMVATSGAIRAFPCRFICGG